MIVTLVYRLLGLFWLVQEREASFSLGLGLVLLGDQVLWTSSKQHFFHSLLFWMVLALHSKTASEVQSGGLCS